MNEIDIILEILDIHKQYVNTINKHKLTVKIRKPIFPEFLSENIIKYILIKKLKLKDCKNAKTGDLIYKKLKFECKCISSKGPISFGPTEKWDKLYILDMRGWLESDIVKLYEINMNDEDFKKIKVNKLETFGDQCLQKRRPRITIEYLQKQVKLKLIYNDSLQNLF